MTEPKQKDREEPAEGRRGALRALCVLGGVAYGAALAIPAAAFVTGAAAGASDGKARWVRVGRLADLEPGKPRRLQLVGDERDAFTVTKDQVLGSVWLTRDGEKVRALSATCPHLGCSIDLNADGASFGCPCHSSRFSVAGAAESGPSPRAMDPLDARVTDGFVEVDFRRFRIGVAERTEAG